MTRHHWLADAVGGSGSFFLLFGSVALRSSAPLLAALFFVAQLRVFGVLEDEPSSRNGFDPSALPFIGAAVGIWREKNFERFVAVSCWDVGDFCQSGRDGSDVTVLVCES